MSLPTGLSMLTTTPRLAPTGHDISSNLSRGTRNKARGESGREGKWVCDGTGTGGATLRGSKPKVVKSERVRHANPLYKKRRRRKQVACVACWCFSYIATEPCRTARAVSPKPVTGVQAVLEARGCCRRNTQHLGRPSNFGVKWNQKSTRMYPSARPPFFLPSEPYSNNTKEKPDHCSQTVDLRRHLPAQSSC